MARGRSVRIWHPHLASRPALDVREESPALKRSDCETSAADCFCSRHFVRSSSKATRACTIDEPGETRHISTRVSILPRYDATSALALGSRSTFPIEYARSLPGSTLDTSESRPVRIRSPQGHGANVATTRRRPVVPRWRPLDSAAGARFDPSPRPRLSPGLLFPLPALPTGLRKTIGSPDSG
jgi:hypothetical protein